MFFSKCGKPSEVKSHEKNRLNAAYAILGEHQFYLAKGVKYIWVHNEKNKVVIGIEDISSESNINALLKAGCVDEKTACKLREYRKQTINPEVTMRLGHPTLSMSFENDINIPDLENVIIAGELFYENDIWELNNISGRFQYLQVGEKLEAINILLTMVSREIETHLHIVPAIKIFNRLNPSMLWEKTAKKDEGDLAEKGLVVLKKLYKFALGKPNPVYEEIKSALQRKEISRTLDKESAMVSLEDVLAFYNTYIKSDHYQDLSKKFTSIQKNIINTNVQTFITELETRMQVENKSKSSYKI